MRFLLNQPTAFMVCQSRPVFTGLLTGKFHLIIRFRTGHHGFVFIPVFGCHIDAKKLSIQADHTGLKKLPIKPGGLDNKRFVCIINADLKIYYSSCYIKLYKVNS